MNWMPRHVLAAQSIVVGDEEIHVRRRRAGKLDRVRRPDRTVPTNVCEAPRGTLIERQHCRPCFDGMLVAPHQRLVARLHGLHQNLAERERGGQQLVLPLDHPLAQRHDLLGPLAPIFQQVHEEVRVPENPAQRQPSRSLST